MAEGRTIVQKEGCPRAQLACGSFPPTNCSPNSRVISIDFFLDVLLPGIEHDAERFLKAQIHLLAANDHTMIAGHLAKQGATVGSQEQSNPTGYLPLTMIHYLVSWQQNRSVSRIDRHTFHISDEIRQISRLQQPARLQQQKSAARRATSRVRIARRGAERARSRTCVMPALVAPSHDLCILLKNTKKNHSHLRSARVTASRTPEPNAPLRWLISLSNSITYHPDQHVSTNDYPKTRSVWKLICRRTSLIKHSRHTMTLLFRTIVPPSTVAVLFSTADLSNLAPRFTLRPFLGASIHRMSHSHPCRSTRAAPLCWNRTRVEELSVPKRRSANAVRDTPIL